MNKDIKVKIWSSSELESHIRKNHNILKVAALENINDYLTNPYALCQKFKPQNINEWRMYYRTSPDGQSLDELKKSALKLYKDVKEEFINLSYEECFNILYSKAIYETFNEFMFNKKVNKELEPFGIKLWDYDKRLKVTNDSRFKLTNDMYNKKGFNKLNNIGYCMGLIKTCKPTSRISWQKYYYDSGKEEKEELKKENLDENLKHAIYCNYGKDLKRLVRLAEHFRNELNSNLSDGVKPYTLEECFNYIYIRAIDKTYIGYMREVIAFDFLKDFCKNHGLELVDTNKKTDIKNSVDFEIRQKGKLILGIQVKGTAYKRAINHKNTAIMNAAEITRKNHSKYTRINNVPILWVYVNRKLNVDNQNIVNDIRKEVNRVAKNNEKGNDR